MTTAHRPTFDPARGKEANTGVAYHQRLLPAHTHLKTRQRGQGGVAGLPPGAAQSSIARPSTADTSSTGEKRKIADVEADTPADADAQPEEEEQTRKRRILAETADMDAESNSDNSASDPASSDSEEEEEEDEEAELLRELAKIKAERAAAKRREEEEAAAKEQEQREIDIARGNPLLNGGSEGGSGAGGSREFGIKRRWDDDVVFRNQGRGTEERGKRREFVNDLLRSDFHKRFMSKYVR